MREAGFWEADWLLGLALSAAMLLAVYAAFVLLGRLRGPALALRRLPRSASSACPCWRRGSSTRPMRCSSSVRLTMD